MYWMPQAPGPFGLEAPYEAEPAAPAPRAIVITPPAPVATAGRTAETPTTALRPRGTNAVWVTFQGRRWYTSGPAVPLARQAFARVGTYHGFPVFRRRNEPGTIHIPSADDLVAPYSLEKPPARR